MAIRPSSKPAPRKSSNLKFSGYPLPPGFLAFVSTLVIFLAAFLIFRPYYLSDDDSQMSLIASGWGGQGPSEFLVCINVILGFILKWLYTLWHGFTWYGVLHFLLFFLSTWTVLALLLEKRPFTGPWVAVLGVQAAAFIHYFSHVEFTITAFLAAQAGVLLL